MPNLLPGLRSSRRWRLVAIVVILAAVLGAEVALRVTLGLGHPPLSYADPDYGYAFVPNQHLHRFGRRIYYNALGLRSEEMAAVKPATTLRVLTIGDSVNNGGVLTDQAETYPYLLAAELRSRGLRAETLNASAGSWGVENELAFLRKKGLFGSDVVVHQIGTHDLWQGKSTGDKVGKEVEMPDRNPPSALVELLHRYLWPRIWSKLAPAPARTSGPTDADRRRVLAAIGETVRYVRGQGAQIVLLLTPNREELDQPQLYAEWREPFFTLARQLDVPCVDMLPIFIQAARRQNPFRDGVHPNPFGNSCMARAVAGQLVALRAPLVSR